HYAEGFDDRDQWLAFRMTDVSGKAVGHAYALRNSSLSRNLLRHLPHQHSNFLAIVRLACNAEAHSNQAAELVELVQPGWLALNQS
ncbi:MAG: hypothetical protein AAF514_07420, partial [Verrucomicrobiota bacterium]